MTALNCAIQYKAGAVSLFTFCTFFALVEACSVLLIMLSFPLLFFFFSFLRIQEIPYPMM